MAADTPRVPRGSSVWWERWKRMAIPVLTVGLITSLLLHAWTLAQLQQTRQLARDQIAALASQIAAFRGQTLELPIAINQDVPVRAAIPINEQLTVPINTSVRIQQDVEIPLETPLGTVSVPVPLDLTVPVNTDVPIVVDTTVDISTTVNLDLNVPITIPVQDSSFAGYLEQLQQRLEALSREL